MGCIPKRSLFLIFCVSFLLSCGGDDDRHIRAMGVYGPAVTAYLPATPYVVPRYVPIVPRSIPYRYVAGYDSFYRGRSRYALDTYLGCRAYKYPRSAWGLTRCGFPYRYRYYEVVARHLDCAMEEFWNGHRHRGCWYLSQAQGALPGDDPLGERLAEIQAAASTADDEELQTLTMEALGDAASRMSPSESE
jgi:hypothetical protein